MNRSRALLTVLMGAALMLGLVAPTAQATQRKAWVSGTGVGDVADNPADWACELQDPENGVVASVFTSDRGPERGLNGCWYFDFSDVDLKVIELSRGRYKALQYPDEHFVGTLNGKPVEFSTDGAVVVTLWQGYPFEPASEQLAGGCWHPLADEDGSGALVFIEEVGSWPPTLRYYGRIAVR